MAPRSRWTYSDDGAMTIANVVAPLITSLGWLVYGEKMDESVRDKKKLLEFATLLRFLKQQSENLSFKQEDFTRIMAKAFGLVSERLPEMSETQCEYWNLTYAKRIRTMCRHCSQAAACDKQPKWYTDIFASAPTSAPASSSAPASISAPASSSASAKPARRAARPPTVKEYTYGWDAEIERAYREDVVSGHRDLAKPFAKEGAAAHDPLWARWDDGDEHEVGELCVADLKDGKLSRKPSGKRSCHWTGLHTPSGLPLRLADRPDKPGTVYFSLYLQDRQVIGLKKSDDADLNNKYFELMKKLAESFGAGEVVQKDLYKRRDELLRADKLPVPRGGGARSLANMAKRPAAAEADSEEAADDTSPQVEELVKEKSGSEEEENENLDEDEESEAEVEDAAKNKNEQDEEESEAEVEDAAKDTKEQEEQEEKQVKEQIQKRTKKEKQVKEPKKRRHKPDDKKDSEPKRAKPRPLKKKPVAAMKRPAAAAAAEQQDARKETSSASYSPVFPDDGSLSEELFADVPCACTTNFELHVGGRRQKLAK